MRGLSDRCLVLMPSNIQVLVRGASLQALATISIPPNALQEVTSVVVRKDPVKDCLPYILVVVGSDTFM